jgi:hypothetical protein
VRAGIESVVLLLAAVGVEGVRDPARYFSNTGTISFFFKHLIFPPNHKIGHII